MKLPTPTNPDYRGPLFLTERKESPRAIDLHAEDLDERLRRWREKRAA